MQTKQKTMVNELFKIIPTFRKRFIKLIDAVSDIHLTPTQIEALFVVQMNEGVRMGDLANLLALSKQHLTKIVDELEKRKLVVRKQSEINKRVIHIFLTSEGKNLYEKIYEMIVQHEAMIFESMSEEQYEKNIEAIRIVRGLLESE